MHDDSCKYVLYMCFSDLKKRSYYGRPFLALDSLPTERMALHGTSICFGYDSWGHSCANCKNVFSLFPALSFSISIRLYLSIFLSRSLLRHRNKHCSSCSSHFTSSANSSSTWRLIKSASALAHLTRHLSEPDCQVSWHTVHKIHNLLDMLSIGINALWRFVGDVPLGQVDEDHQHDAPSQTQSARSDSSESNVLHFPELSEHVEIWNVESGIALNLLILV